MVFTEYNEKQTTGLCQIYNLQDWKKNKHDKDIIVFTIHLSVQLIYGQFAAIFTVTDYMRQTTVKKEYKIARDEITQQMAAFITISIFPMLTMAHDT